MRPNRLAALVLLLILVLFAVRLLHAQTYSRWNYSDTTPNNTSADNAMVAEAAAFLDQCQPDTVFMWVRYTYTGTDSSFEMLDPNNWIVRVFEPTPPPDGVAEVTRANEVAMIGKASPVKVSYWSWPDVSSLPGGNIRAATVALINAAKAEGKALRKAVDDSVKKNPSSGNTAKKRANLWKVIKAKKNAEKIKNK